MSSFKDAVFLVNSLNEKGYKAYLVGGCVRDMLRECAPGDYDIATSALPCETKRALDFCGFADTGIKHGTVTALYAGGNYEITTFRQDGDYRDSRRPEHVEFLTDIREDLARRDFTMNAVAMSPSGEIIDPFGGAKDIASGVIRCVGEPGKRFKEDALRILRAMRFAAHFGYIIDKATETAMFEEAGELNKISRERVAAELSGMLLGEYAEGVLLSYRKIIFECIPELKATDGFCQHSRWHCYDVYTHTCRAVGNADRQLTIRLAALLHDVEKPSCFSLSADGHGHFFGHYEASSLTARAVLTRLRFDSRTVKEVETLIKYHSLELESNEKTALKWSSRLGTELFERLLKLMLADDLSKNPEMAAGSAERDRSMLKIVEALKRGGACVSVSDLDIKGGDLLAIGVAPGPRIGETLKKLLDAVQGGFAENTKAALLEYYNKHLAE